MKKVILSVAVSVFAASLAPAALAAGSQQNKMKECNASAGELKGDVTSEKTSGSGHQIAHEGCRACTPPARRVSTRAVEAAGHSPRGFDPMAHAAARFSHE